MGRHLDFRERFLERKRLRSLKDQRITALNNYVFNNTEVLDDIAHYRKIKGRSSPTWKKIRALEKDFRRLLAMKGMKYNYKRDLFWRTWRSIPPVNGDTTQIVNYKCNNPIHSNTKECQNCGMWTIEDRTPPCPYEFFSVLSDEKLCGANYTQYKDVYNICPSVIKFSDLTATCDNPIETQWRFTKMYGVTETYDEVICKNKDFCEIFTLYEITPEHVIFRIVNSTNDVIYSRIMKAKNRNYICVEDCGRFNPNTRKVAKADKPLKLDLLTMRKSKREGELNELNDDITKTDVLNKINDIQIHLHKLMKGEDTSNEMNDMQMHLHKLIKGEGSPNEMNDNVLKREDVLNEMSDGFHLPTKLTRGDVSNEMNDSIWKREDVFNEINDSFHLPTKLTKGDLSNEMHDGIRKREDVLNEMNDGFHLPTKLTKGDLSNEMHDGIRKREYVLNVMIDGFHLPTKLTKGDLSNEMHDGIRKREDVLNEMSDGFHLPTKLTKGDLSNEINVIVPKREVLNEYKGLHITKTEDFNDILPTINDGFHLPTKLTRGDVSNEMNDSIRKRKAVLNEMNDGFHLPTKLTKGDLSNEMHDGIWKREDVLNEINAGFHLPTKLTKGDLSNEINDNVPKREVLNELNKGLHITKTEDLNDILPTMEENMSLSNFDGDEYVSIEDTRPRIDWVNRKRKMNNEKKSLYKIKSRGMKGRQQSNINSVVKQRFLLRPTITPRQKLKREADHLLYEDLNLETDY